MMFSASQRPLRSGTAFGRYTTVVLSVVVAVGQLYFRRQLSDWVTSGALLIYAWCIFTQPTPHPSVRNTLGQIYRGYREGVWPRASGLHKRMGYAALTLFMAGFVLKLMGH